jgi:uncharacterized protein (TIGR00369 family)
MKLIPRNPQFKDRITKQLEHQKFMHLINFDLTKIEAGYTEGELNVTSIHHQHDGFLHGGVVATIADIVAGFAACTLVDVNQNVVTGEIKVSYFAKGKGTKLKAIGRVIKAGRRMSFCEAEIYSITEDDEKMIAKASTSMITI